MRVLTTLLITFIVSIAWAQTDFFNNLSESALSLTHQKVTYDPKYYSITYPNGDIPSDRGVCTDVVIRAYGKLGIDLQKEVHEDMKTNYAEHPKSRGLKTKDKKKHQLHDSNASN